MDDAGFAYFTQLSSVVPRVDNGLLMSLVNSTYFINCDATLRFLDFCRPQFAFSFNFDLHHLAFRKPNMLLWTHLLNIITWLQPSMHLVVDWLIF